MEGLEELKVIDLIDLDSSEWMDDLLEEPHSLLPLLSTTPRVRRRALSPFHTCASDHMIPAFDCVGSMLVKMPHQFVRRITNTKSDLSKKHVQLEEKLCPFCRGEIETTTHVFKECNVVACFWLFSPLGLRASNHGANNMVEWLTEMMETLQTKQVENIRVIILLALIKKSEGKGSNRNEHGSVVGAWSKKLENMSYPLHAEAETARLGLLTALQQGWTNLEVECNCAILVAALNRQSDDMVEGTGWETQFLPSLFLLFLSSLLFPDSLCRNCPLSGRRRPAASDHRTGLNRLAVDPAFLLDRGSFPSVAVRELSYPKDPTAVVVLLSELISPAAIAGAAGLKRKPSSRASIPRKILVSFVLGKEKFLIETLGLNSLF
ncbi:hypothetical protein ACLB2K_004363 [Fragaria x ananassa]